MTGQAGQVSINLSEVAAGYLPVCNQILRNGIKGDRISTPTREQHALDLTYRTPRLASSRRNVIDQ